MEANNLNPKPRVACYLGEATAYKVGTTKDIGRRYLRYGVGGVGFRLPRPAEPRLLPAHALRYPVCARDIMLTLSR